MVDDNEGIRTVVRAALEPDGVRVHEAACAEDALAALREGGVDLVILDLELPEMTGLELLPRLRALVPDVYVLMLSGRASEDDRVRGLVSGADDYMAKPFGPRELAAKVAAVARRWVSPAAMTTIHAGDVVIDTAVRSVTVRGTHVPLTRREFDLLVYLASNQGRTITRGELLRIVWSSSAEYRQATTVTEHVRRLRQKLENDPTDPTMLVTVRGTGYRFIAPPAVDAPTADVGRASDATAVIVGTKIRAASESMASLLAVPTVGDLIGRDVFELIAPESLTAMRARQDRALNGHWPRPELVTVVRPDGARVIVEITSTPVLWNGEPASQVTLWSLGSGTSFVDELVTGFRDELPDAVIVTTDDLRIQSFNAAAEELYGWRREEVIGRSLTETIGWDSVDAPNEVQQELFDAGRWHGEALQRRRDGSVLRVRSSRTLLRNSAGDTVGVISVNRPMAPIAVWRDAGDGDARDVDAIRLGLSRGEFDVHYQPIVALASDEIVGVEALARWSHPERGLLQPSAFIAVAETTSAIDDLGSVVLDEACRQVAKWRADGHDLHLAVNLSARQLGDPTLIDRIDRAITACSVPPNLLWLEVTETALVEDIDVATDTLRRIADLGVRVAIDDFGTGWASLTYLREFPVHALKIDRVFVAGLGTASRDEAIVASMVSLGNELDVVVIAEGIETEEQRQTLQRLGCPLGQGYLFGRPTGAQDTERLLRRWRGTDGILD